MWNWSVTSENTRLYYERWHKNKTQIQITIVITLLKLIDNNTSTPKLHVLRYEKNNVDAVLINFPLLQLTSQRINKLPVIMMIESDRSVISDFSFTTDLSHLMLTLPWMISCSVQVTVFAFKICSMHKVLASFQTKNWTTCLVKKSIAKRYDCDVIVSQKFWLCLFVLHLMSVISK